MAKQPKVNKKAAQIYIWTGLNRTGKKVKGEMEAKTPAYVSAALRRQGIKPGKIRKKPKDLFAHARKITTKDITVFTRQLATMIAAGIPIAQSIDIVANGHENPSMREQLTAIRLDVESGTSRLHKSITDSRSDKTKTTFIKVLTHGIRFNSICRYFGM